MNTERPLTPKATQEYPRVTYAAWIQAGWTDEQLLAHGYLEPTLEELRAALRRAKAAMKAEGSTPQAPGPAYIEWTRAKSLLWIAEQAEKKHKADEKQQAKADRERLLKASVIITVQQAEVFRGCCYVEDIHAIVVPGVPEALDQKRFDVRFSGLYQLGEQKTTDSAWKAYTTSRVLPRVDATYFDPRDPPGHTRTDEQGRTALNTYIALELRRAAGDASPFTDHVRKILPNGNDADILIAYLAACVQHPGVKAAWAPLLQGVEGNGKSLLVEIMARAIGRCYTHQARADHIDGRFNAHLYGKLFVAFNEVKVTQDKQSVWETLKSYVTDVWQQIEYKGGAIVQRELLFNMLFCTNHTDALPKTQGDRRICPLFCAQQTAADLLRDGMLDEGGHTSRYFMALYHWLEDEDGYAIAADYLATYDIPAELNFAKDCKRAPVTTSTGAAIEASMDTGEQEVVEAIESGMEGFRGGWVASHALNMVLDRVQRARNIAKNKRRSMLKTMGYVPHPGVKDGRVPMPLPDGQRPRLYIKPGHPSGGLEGVAVVAAYLEAQKSQSAAALAPAPPPTPHR